MRAAAEISKSERYFYYMVDLRWHHRDPLQFLQGEAMAVMNPYSQLELEHETTTVLMSSQMRRMSTPGQQRDRIKMMES